MIMEQLDMYMEKINFDPLQKILFKADQSSQYKRQNKKLAEGKWMSLSCVWLCDPMDYTIHGMLQARILEGVVFPFSRGSSQARDWTQVSHIAGSFFTSWATREAQEYWSG